jgi:hypothetical protein
MTYPSAPAMPVSRYPPPSARLPTAPAFMDQIMSVQKLSDLKAKSPTNLLAMAEELEVENASSMRKQDMLFAILKEMAERDEEIIGTGVLEVLQDGFGFLRSPAEGGRAVFCAAEGQHDQFRGSGESAPQGALRQSDAALS